MKLFKNLVFYWLLGVVCLYPHQGFTKVQGFLPLKTFPPVMVQKADTCVKSCKNVRVYVTNNCIYEITPAEVLGECFALFQGYIIVYDGVGMSPTRGGVIDRLGIFPFTIYNSKGGLECLGQVFVRDTIGPVFKDDVAKRDWESRDTLILAEKDIPSVLNNDKNWVNTDAPLYLGIPQVKDGCSPNFIHRNVKDEFISFPCDSVIKFTNGRSYPHLTAKIKRTFTFTDNSGNKTNFVQEIFFRKPGNAATCDAPASLSFDYAPNSIFAFGPLGDNPRWKAHPDFPAGKTDLINTFYRCAAPDDIRFDVCTISDSLQLDRIIKAVYSAPYQWPNGYRDTLSIFDKNELWKVSYKSKYYTACNDGKRVRIILTIEDLCQNQTITDTLWIYFSRTSGPTFPALSGGQNTVLGRNPANPVFVPLPGNACKSDMLLPFTHGTEERNLGTWFNWTVQDECTPRANLSLSYVVESKLSISGGKFKSDTSWNQLNYPIIHTALGSYVKDVPAGSHRIIIAATAGACEAISYDTLHFVLQDQVFPKARCKSSITLPLLYSGLTNWYSDGRTNKVSARLRTDMVNNGSSDNCALDTLYLRRVVSASCISENFLGNPDYDLYGNKDGKVTLDDFQRISTGKNAGLYYTPRYLPYVEYFCCDFGKEQSAELWVGYIGFNGPANNSYCDVRVVLEDMMNPVIFRPNLNAPPNQNSKNWVQCTDTASLQALKDEYKSNMLFGTPTIYNLDCTGKVSYHTVDYITCGSGHITRHWTVEKWVKNTLITVRDSQVILVRPSHRFTLNIPADTTAFCDSGAAQSLTVSSGGCDIFTISYVDSLLSRQNNEANCLTIQRTYTLINGCDLPAPSDCPDDSFPPARYARTIPRTLNNAGKALPFFHALSRLNAEKNRLISENEPVVYDTSRIFTGASPGNLRAASLNDYPVENSLLCENDQVFAWKYTQILTLFDTTKPTVVIPDSSITILSNGSCNAPVSFTFKVLDNCSFSTISLDSITLFEKNTQKKVLWAGNIDRGIYEKGLLTVRLSAIQPGNYDVRVVVSDNCGQKAISVLPVSVITSNLQSLDCVARITKNMQVNEREDDGFVKVTISDALTDKSLISKLSSCYPGAFLSIKRVSDMTGTYVPVPADSLVQISCSSFTNQAIPLKVFLTNNNGVSISCDIALFLTDSFQYCSPKFVVSGSIKTISGKPVSNVRVHLAPLTKVHGQTGTSGIFNVPSVPSGGPYSLKPVSPIDFKNGVSTLDLVLLQRFLLQGQPFKTPYQYLAADVDNSGTISIRDLLELRKLIINLTSKFEKNTSWRFIPSSFVFPDSLNPWASSFPEEILFPSISKDTSGSFVAVKIGDLSGDAPTGQDPGVQVRNQLAPWPLYYTLSEPKEGGDYLVSFFFDGKNKPEGFQSTIHWNPKSSNQITFLPGILNEEYVHPVMERGYVNVSSEKLEREGILFSLLFSSPNLPLGELFLSDRILNPEAYQGMQIFPVHLVRKEFQKEDFRFDPPAPNPFYEETAISFYLPQPIYTEVILSDLSGRVLKKWSGEASKGLNQWTLNLSDIPAEKVLFCSIRAGNFEAIRQLVRIK